LFEISQISVEIWGQKLSITQITWLNCGLFCIWVKFCAKLVSLNLQIKDLNMNVACSNHYGIKYAEGLLEMQ
jgi:hypothetical protein